MFCYFSYFSNWQVQLVWRPYMGRKVKLTWGCWSLPIVELENKKIQLFSLTKAAGIDTRILRNQSAGIHTISDDVKLHWSFPFIRFQYGRNILVSVLVTFLNPISPELTLLHTSVWNFLPITSKKVEFCVKPPMCPSDTAAAFRTFASLSFKH